MPITCYYVNNNVVATKQLTKRAVQILDSKYEASNVLEVVDEQAGLNTCQNKAALYALVLSKNIGLFNGELGYWDSSPVSIELLNQTPSPFMLVPIWYH
jgi:hypothetical protein